MDFSREGLIGIEDIGNEPEVLGHAFALGQAFAEVAKEEGQEIPASMDQFSKSVVSLVVEPLPPIMDSVLKKFKDAKIDQSARYINDGDELRVLMAGLTILNKYSAVPLRNRYQAIDKRRIIGLAGKNGAILLDRDRMREVSSYRQQIASHVMH